MLVLLLGFGTYFSSHRCLCYYIQHFCKISMIIWYFYRHIHDTSWKEIDIISAKTRIFAFTKIWLKLVWCLDYHVISMFWSIALTIIFRLCYWLGCSTGRRMLKYHYYWIDIKAYLSHASTGILTTIPRRYKLRSLCYVCKEYLWWLPKICARVSHLFILLTGHITATVSFPVSHACHVRPGTRSWSIHNGSCNFRVV